MLERFRQFWTQIFSPLARLLLKWGISPNAVTVVGTIGVVAGSVIFFPIGKLFIGVLVITAFAFSDLVDGHMARASGQTSLFGAFLDSTLDRLSDAAIFGGLAMYYVGPGDNHGFAALAIYCLSMGFITSYVRARAESLGMKAKVGIAERSDRLVLVLVVTGVADLARILGAGDKALDAIPIALAALSVASTITVAQRIAFVRVQALAKAAGADEQESVKVDA